jgi:predicted nuclease with RNAse H fold
MILRVGPWIGVDVGGKKKAFDLALVHGRTVVELRSRQSAEDVVELTRAVRPTVVAVDSPRSTAPPGATRRDGEKLLREAVCGIRWTPPRDKLDGNQYYEWIVEGLRLYEALADVRVEVIECFPTASWTRWQGPRGSMRRAVWTRQALGALSLDGVPARTNQDQRDAIAAALTARAYAHGECDCYGDIVVPR